jgi:hypothetical protein
MNVNNMEIDGDYDKFPTWVVMQLESNRVIAKEVMQL